MVNPAGEFGFDILNSISNTYIDTPSDHVVDFKGIKNKENEGLYVLL